MNLTDEVLELDPSLVYLLHLPVISLHLLPVPIVLIELEELAEHPRRDLLRLLIVQASVVGLLLCRLLLPLVLLVAAAST
jgi:hypothetical protein